MIARERLKSTTWQKIRRLKKKSVPQKFLEVGGGRGEEITLVERYRMGGNPVDSEGARPYQGK